MNNYEKLTEVSDDMQSQTPIPANVKKLKELFPAVVQDGQVDFDALRQLLGESIAESDERYGLQWPGKNAARLEALTPSTKTLRPCVADSKDWPTTKNLYIEGDNLEVLKLLQKSYSGKIKMIYIDPPYNTGQDSFIYPDDYRMSRTEYMEVSNQLRKFKKNQKDCGRFHTNWLNMMFPRLMLAHELLCDDGVIFISIDDNEMVNLKKICDEIFGSASFVAQLVWEKKKKGSFLSNSITNIKEYILVYCKNKEHFQGLIGEINDTEETYPCINAVNKRELRIIPAGIESKYRETNFFMSKGSEISDTTMSIVLHSDLVIQNGVLAKELILEGNWRYSQSAMKEYALKKELYITRDLYLRRIVKETRYKTMKDLLPRVGEDSKISPTGTVDTKNLNSSGWGSNEDADEELRLLFGVQKLMDYPKPVRLILKLLASYRNSDRYTVLDFFSGSATTAHAVMKLNAEDGGNRRFIMVQYPEVCDEGSEAAKAGFKNICEIGKERIRLAGKKIKDAVGENSEKLDTGFRVFKVDDSNVIPWDTNPEKFEEQLLKEAASESGHLQEGRTSDDFFYEVLLKQGIELTQEFEEQEIAGHKVYSLGRGMYYCCFDERIGNEAADLAAGIAEWHNEQDPDGKDCVVFVRDSAFDDANVMHGTDARESDARKQSFCATLVQSGIMKVKAF